MGVQKTTERLPHQEAMRAGEAVGDGRLNRADGRDGEEIVAHVTQVSVCERCLAANHAIILHTLHTLYKHVRALNSRALNGHLGSDARRERGAVPARAQQADGAPFIYV